MMKNLLCAVLALLMLLSGASAAILPAEGVDRDFQAWTGIEATPAVVLCQSLSVLDARGDQGGRVVTTRSYSGTDTIPVLESWDGWAKISYADGTKTGWVRSDYLMFDPVWYVCDGETQVYAYPDGMSPRVALLDEGEKLPILTETSVDGSEWVCVSLRGAAGWIRKTPADTVSDTWFRPEMLAGIVAANLETEQSGITLTGDTEYSKIVALREMLTHVQDRGGPVAGCPFGATLTLWLMDGRTVTLQLATDSCCVYRVDGRDYSYARQMFDEDGSPENDVLFSLFGLSAAQAQE